MAVTLILPLPCLWAKSLKGNPAPEFSLSDVKGVRYSLSELKGSPILILYFFDATSRASQEGLFSLNNWVKKYKEADLQAWGITRSLKAGVNDLIARSDLAIPILMDQSNVSDLYNARMVLPTVCIISHEKKVIEFIQGGGKSTEIMLSKVTEMQLQSKHNEVAEKMGKELIAKDPENSEIKALTAHAQLRSGKIDEAENTLKTIPSHSSKDKVLKEEGMSEVYLAKGDFEKAWASAKTLEKTAPKSGAANVSKAKVLLSKGEKEAAEKELAKGITKESTFTFQKSEAINKQGRLKASRGDTQAAMDLYSQAEDIDPFNIEATSNKGLLLEKEGRLDQALNAYRKVLKINEKDVYASVFAKRVEAKLAVESDLEKKKRMDALIKNLAERFRRQKNQPVKAVQDDWTSRPMVLSFINIKESGGLPDRDGFVLVLVDQLAEFLNTSGRLEVVDRRMLESIMDELNLGSSELADPKTALKLGKLFAAKIIVTGTVHYLPGETLLSLRLLDTETSRVVKVLTRQLESALGLEKELGKINQLILKTVSSQYPLKGYVANVEDNQVMINIGKNQGVVLGTEFHVVKDAKPIVYKGKVLSGALKKVALLKVIQVEPEFSTAKIISKEDAVHRDDKITETMAEI